MTRFTWQKSSFSGEGNACVELAVADSVILLRESDEPDVTASTTSAGLSALIRSIKAGKLTPGARLGVDWQKSSYSGTQGDCVELSAANGSILIRESDYPEMILAVAASGLKVLIRSVRAGEFHSAAGDCASGPV